MKYVFLIWGILICLSVYSQNDCDLGKKNCQDYFYLPEMRKKPLKYWSCSNVMGISSRNEIDQIGTMQGLQYHLMCQSLVGLTNLAVEEGRSDIAVWLYDHSGKSSYQKCKQALECMGIREQGIQNGLDLACKDYSFSEDGINIQLKRLFDGYILTDIRNNQESGVVAAVASHVYNSIIVDIRDKEFYEAAGYKMKYDARYKTTNDAWREFKDKCKNNALVIMPAQTGELREFAIKNRLFVLNLNKDSRNPYLGKNTDLLKEVLEWLEPNAPVLGWEQNVSEDEFVGPVSLSGHPMLPCDWSYNHSLTSLLYSERQNDIGTDIVYKPQLIDFTKKKKFVSFFLSDGDNIQWMMQDFVPEYYDIPESEQVKMTFGLPVVALSMMAPSWLDVILNKQRRNSSIMEMLGGGYYYIDTYSLNNNRQKNLKIMAERLAQNMQKRNIKLLGVMAMDINSEAAKEAFQAYVDANSQLEGIIVLQYTPYAGGEGKVFWVTNREGLDIPVITTKYSIWDRLHEREGTPDFVADKLKEDTNTESYSIVCVHAWSSFNGIKGAGAAKMCMEKLGDDFEVVNLQELIWRLRMSERPDQTKKKLSF